MRLNIIFISVWLLLETAVLIPTPPPVWFLINVELISTQFFFWLFVTFSDVLTGGGGGLMPLWLVIFCAWCLTVDQLRAGTGSNRVGASQPPSSVLSHTMTSPCVFTKGRMWAHRVINEGHYTDKYPTWTLFIDLFQIVLQFSTSLWPCFMFVGWNFGLLI